MSRFISVEDTLKQWGIAVEQDEYFLEHLQEQYPNNIFFIDYCPFPAGDKYDQVEILFQEVLERKANRDEYMRIERKFNDVMVKLWLYNEVYVYFNYIYTKRYNKGYRKLFRQYIKGCPASKNNPIRDRKVLEMLTRLSFRKSIQIEIYLKEFQMVVVPSFSCFVVYFHDIFYKEVVEKIVNVEGLYLRKYYMDSFSYADIANETGLYSIKDSFL